MVASVTLESRWLLGVASPRAKAIYGSHFRFLLECLQAQEAADPIPQRGQLISWMPLSENNPDSDYELFARSFVPTGSQQKIPEQVTH